VKAVNKRLKYNFLFTTKLLNIEQTKRYLTDAVEGYNSKPQSSLHGLAPAEVFNGALPYKNLFKPAIRQAASKRKMVNLHQKYLDCFNITGKN
jgi:putative transposase